jgi:CRP/FNR family transcriptional regulator, anaerobic regulatory protein
MKISDQPINELKKHIDTISLLSSEAWEDLVNIVRISEMKDEEFLFKEGARATDEVFLVRGILRGFYRSYDGREVNVAFYTENNVLPPHYFRTKNMISQLNIQALSDAIVAVFNTDQFSALRYKHENLMRYGNVIVERELEFKTQREIVLLTEHAEERYKTFRIMYPGLENHISQYHIASYLGITPVSLSRIRKSLVKK